MPILSSLLMGGAGIVGNYVLWGLKPGKYLAQGIDFINEQVKPILGQIMGSRFKDIKVSRLADKDGKLVFLFANVPIIDDGEIEKRIVEESEKIATDDDKKNAKEDENIAVNEQYYNVKLSIKNRDVKLGEIDYLDWEKQGFEIQVVKVGNNEEVVSEQDRAKVIATLKKLPKVTLNSKLTPDQIAGENIAISNGFFVNFWNKYVNGKVVEQPVNVEDGRNDHIATDRYIDSLISVAVDNALIGKEGGDSIFENYYGVRKREIENELCAVKTMQKKLIDFIKGEEKKQRKVKIILAAVAVGAVVVLAGLAVLTVFFPVIGGPILGFIATIVPATIKFFGSKLFAGIAWGAGIGVIAGFAKGWYDYSAETYRLAKEEKLPKVEAAKENLRSELEDIETAEKEASNTLRALKGKELTLDENASQIGLAIVCEYLLRSRGCSLQKINLIKCLAIEKSLTLSEIAEFKTEIKALNEVLGSNFSLTDLQYNRDVIDKKTRDEIDRQLSINSFLRNTRYAVGAQRVTELFPGNSIENAALDKVKNNFNFIDSELFSSLSKRDFSNEVQKLVRQNVLLATLTQEIKNPVRVKNALDAFVIDQNRFLAFIHERRLEASIKESIKSYPWLLQDLQDSDLKNLLEREFEITNHEVKNTLARFLRILPKVATIGGEEKNKVEECLKELLGNAKNYNGDVKVREIAKGLLVGILNLKGEAGQEGKHNDLVQILSEFVEPNKSPEQIDIETFVNSISDKTKLNEFIEFFSNKKRLLADVANMERVKNYIKNHIYGDRNSLVFTQLLETDKKGCEVLFNILFNNDKRHVALVYYMFIEIAKLDKTDKRNFGDLLKEFDKHDYWWLQRGLEKKRQEALKNSDDKLATAIDNMLQPALWIELGIDRDSNFKENYNKLENQRWLELRQVPDHKQEKDDAKEVITRNKLRDLLMHYPKPLTSAVFKKFLNICQDVDPKDLLTILNHSTIDKKKFNELLQLDVYDKSQATMFEILKGVDKEKRRIILQFYFNEEEAGAKKASLLSRVIESNNNFNFSKAANSEKDSIEYTLYYSFFAGVGGILNFSHPYTYEELRAALEVQRKLLKVKGMNSEAEKINNILQDDWRERLDSKVEFSETEIVQLIESIRFDINSANYKKQPYTPWLKKFDEKHRVQLLEKCFVKEGVRNAEGLATLVSGLLEIQGDDVESEYIWRSFYWSVKNPNWDFATYRLKIKELRNSLYRDNQKVSSQIDNVLQSALRVDLVSKYKCLQPNNKDDFNGLKEELDGEIELTSADFSNLNLDPDVLNYVSLIVERNKVYQEFFNSLANKKLQSSKKLEKFIDSYQSVNDKKRRSELLASFLQIPGSRDELLSLFKNDSKNGDQELKRLNQEDRVELFAKCFGMPETHSMAVIASKLVDVQPKVLSGYDWVVYDIPKKLDGEAVVNWFAQCIDSLKKQRDLQSLKPWKSKKSKYEELDEVVQAGLWDNLMYPYQKERIKENYDLVKFDSKWKGLNIDDDAKKYIEFICDRNQLRRYLDRKNSSEFINKYLEVADSLNPEPILEELDRKKVIDRLVEYLGSDIDAGCEKLRQFKEEPLKKLLVHCFAAKEEQNAALKADLIYQLLQQYKASDNDKPETKRFIHDINYYIHGSICSGTFFDSYRYEELTSKVDGLKSKHPLVAVEVAKGLGQVFSEVPKQVSKKTEEELENGKSHKLVDG